MPFELVYKPRGLWADLDWIPPRGGPFPPEEGKERAPALTLKLLSFPLRAGRAAKFQRFPFWPVLAGDGGPVAWLRRGSPIDRLPGVYFLYDREAEKLYIGSSIGQSNQGNMRRTINRHFENWRRVSDWYRKPRWSRKGTDPDPGGVVLPRRDVVACCMLVPLDLKLPPTDDHTKDFPPPRRIESWYLRQICDDMECYNRVGIEEVSRDMPDVPF